MSSNVTLVDKLNPRRPEPNKMQFQISEKFAKSLPKKNNTVKNIVQKESFSINDISSTKVSINNIENKNKSVEEDEKDSIDLENFYVKYLLKLNHLINGTKKKTALESSSESSENSINPLDIIYNPIDLIDKIQQLIQEKIKDFDLKKKFMSCINTIKDTFFDIYEKVKTETINIFNGTTILKIFDAGCALFTKPTESTKETSSKIDSLIEQVKALGKTIESSKFFIHSIIEKVKEDGRLKVVNKLNNNPNHPEYESSFPDLEVMEPKKDNTNTWYPSDLDESFDIEVQEGVLKVNQKFKDRMNRSIEKSNYNYFIDNNSHWTVSDTSDTPSGKILSAITDFQKVYEELQSSQELNKEFMSDFNSSLFIVDGNWIHSTKKEEMIETFKKLVPNTTDQKLISTYAHPKILMQSYTELLDEHPELNQYQIINSRNSYMITHISNNRIKLVTTNLSDVCSKDDHSMKKTHSFGVRTSVILSSKNSPIMKYSYFFE